MTDTSTRALAARASRPAVRPRWQRALVSFAYFAIPIAAVIVIWQLVTMLNPPAPFFPQPFAIIANLWDLLFGSPKAVQQVFYGEFLQTVGRMALGFAIGAVWGIVIGTIMGLWRGARETINPIVEFLRSIPATATLPLFIILLGGGNDMRVVFIAYGVSWFVLINTSVGVGSVHKTLLDVGKVFKISPARRLFRILLPGAMPKIFAGLRIASTAALLLAIVSEFMLATDGVGYMLVQAQGRFQLLNMWSWMLALAILGLIINSLLEWIEGRLLGWHRQSKSRA